MKTYTINLSEQQIIQLLRNYVNGAMNLDSTNEQTREPTVTPAKRRSYKKRPYPQSSDTAKQFHDYITAMPSGTQFRIVDAARGIKATYGQALAGGSAAKWLACELKSGRIVHAKFMVEHRPGHHRLCQGFKRV